ncbi:MAG: hypothetical protein HYY30_01765 [Chloroflexi bacterium]|nr:hypothetical protein [Chloroflexota bacterium]
MRLSLKSLNTLGTFWNIVKELNPESIEREANQRFSIVVVGPEPALNARIADMLTGGRAAFSEALQTVDLGSNGGHSGLPRADLYVYALPSRHVIDIAHAHRIDDIEVKGKPVLLAICSDGDEDRGELLRTASYTFTTLPSHRIVVLNIEDGAGAARRLIPAILESVPQLHLAFGKALPMFRDRAVADLIVEASRVNAEFALLSSLPGSIPIVGGFFASGADLLVLTKNQIMLILKVATIYGRDHHSKMRTLAEIAPVIGGAFFWRTVARTMVGLLPGFVSAVPKAAVAFVGTFVVGNMARYYYSYGDKPTRANLERFYEEALTEARSLLRK